MSNSSVEGREGRGGAFCQFTVGSAQRGTSARHLRYIANPQAVREGREGVWLQGFPPLLAEAPYPVLVGHLCDWAHWLEQEEGIRHKGRGIVRTHYQAILSFEAAVTIPQSRAMLAAWMGEAFPAAQSAAFVHTNTRHLHIHVWIAARQTDGRKINLSARAYRQLDEIWNRIYCRALNRDAREHLLKKGQTERWKQLRREGKAQHLERPARVGHGWKEGMFNERERERLGVTKYDRDQAGVGGDQPASARNTLAADTREPIPALSEPGVAAEAARLQRALANADHAVSEAARLHQDAARLAPRQPEPTLDSPRLQDAERDANMERVR